MEVSLLEFLEWYHERIGMPIEGDEINYIKEYLEE